MPKKYVPTEEEIAAKRADSLGQLTRDDAIEVLTRQAAHDAALEEAADKEPQDPPPSEPEGNPPEDKKTKTAKAKK